VGAPAIVVRIKEEVGVDAPALFAASTSKQYSEPDCNPVAEYEVKTELGE